jgi:tRNA(Ile)-lysidine synthase
MSDAPTLTAVTVFADWAAALHDSPQLLVGYSGGLDSTVLLHLAVQYWNSERIRAVHVNHGLSRSADGWQKHAQDNCAALSVAFSVHRVDCRQSGNQEAAARSERYAAFRRELIDGGMLLLGHHADDQVETVLYHLLRGSGSRGLAGIPTTRKLGLAYLARPLLRLTRADLLAYGRHHGLRWIDDHSNANINFDRNFLRHRVVPAIAERWPDHASRIASSAARSREADALASSVFLTDLERLDRRDERSGLSIGILKLSLLDSPRQRNIIRHMPSELGLQPPSSKAVEEVLKSCVNARVGALPMVVCGNYQYRRYRDKLYVVCALNEHADCAEKSIAWRLDGPLTLPGGGVLMASEEQSLGLRLAASTTVEIGFRRGGERCRPVGRGHSQWLKKLFQEYGLEPWWRSSIPLIYAAGKLVAVGDLWICEGWQVGVGERGLKIHWRSNSVWIHRHNSVSL